MIFRDKEKSRRMNRGLLCMVVFLGALFLPFSGKAEQKGPSEVISRFNATLLESMKRGKQLGYEGRYKLLAPIISDSFALSQMARVVVGKYWGTFTEEERKVYLKTYTAWNIANYAGRFNEYCGEQFRPVSESPPEKGTITVISKLVESSKDEVEFDYQLRQMEGAWRIVDIHIMGISQLALTKVQFVTILGIKGFNGLISMLNGKIRDLSMAGDGRSLRGGDVGSFTVSTMMTGEASH